MAIFAMKGHAGPLFHGSHSARPLEIRGSFYCSGPQPVEDGGCPQWVADIFDRLPGLERIALDGDGRGVVWSRILPDNAELCGGCHRPAICDHCEGSGGDKWNDGITPCPRCDGEGYEWWM